MNRDELIRAAKLSYLSEEDAVKSEEKVNDLLQYVRDIPESEKTYTNSEILRLRNEEITEWPLKNTGYITVLEKKDDYTD